MLISYDSESVFILFQSHLPCLIFGFFSQIAKYSTNNFLNHTEHSLWIGNLPLLILATKGPVNSRYNNNSLPTHIARRGSLET